MRWPEALIFKAARRDGSSNVLLACLRRVQEQPG